MRSPVLPRPAALLAPLLLFACCRRRRPEVFVHGAQPGSTHSRGAGFDRQELGGRGLHAAGRGRAERRCVLRHLAAAECPGALGRAGHAGQLGQLATTASGAPASTTASAATRRFRHDGPGRQSGAADAVHPPGRRLGARRHGGAGQQHYLVRGRRAAGRAGDGALDRRAGRCRARRRGWRRPSGADALLASRLAAQAFSSGDVGPIRHVDGGRDAGQPGGQPWRRRKRIPRRARACSRRRSARTTRTPRPR